MEYCIPHRRELTEEERELLRFLFADESVLALQIDRLKVVARCGCGQCPTVIFGESLDDEPLTSSGATTGDVVADYYGPDKNGTTVGVTLHERDGKVAELEASVVDVGDIEGWPSIESLIPVRQAGHKLEGAMLLLGDDGRATVFDPSSSNRPWWKFW